MKRLAFFLLMLLGAVPAFAWGAKGHLITNEAATLGMPTDMPLFFYRAYPELVYLGPDPDRWNGNGVSLDAENLSNHFLDMELVDGLDLPRDRYRYINLMRDSGTARKHGVVLPQPGFLPWHIAELSELLTAQFRMWRASEPGSPERRAIELSVIHVAGLLGHFVGDASNPDHTTENHNGWIEPNPNHYTTDCEAHSRFETGFISHAMQTSDVVPKLAPPAQRSDYFAAALSLVRGSHSELEHLYTIDRDGGFSTFHPSAEAKEFAAARLAAGASMLRDLWWSAWRNSEKPARRQAPAE